MNSNSVYGAEVGDCGWANLEAGGWQVTLVTVSAARIHTGSHMCAYPTWGQARRARRLVTCQHSSGPFGSLSSKRGQVFVLGVHKARAKQCPDRVQNEWVQCIKSSDNYDACQERENRRQECYALLSVCGFFRGSIIFIFRSLVTFSGSCDDLRNINRPVSFSTGQLSEGKHTHSQQYDTETAPQHMCDGDYFRLKTALYKAWNINEQMGQQHRLCWPTTALEALPIVRKHLPFHE